MRILNYDPMNTRVGIMHERWMSLREREREREGGRIEKEKGRGGGKERKARPGFSSLKFHHPGVSRHLRRIFI